MILEAHNISKSYLHNNNSVKVLDNAGISINANEFISITGRSGSGKSTFLNILAGMLKPSTGSLSFEGKDYSKLGDREISYLRNSSLGYIPQGRSILSNFTVLNNIILPYYLYKRKGDPTKNALELLDRMGLSGLHDRYPNQLSGGELRRVTIARALINSPRIIIADEPTGDLDVQTRHEVLRLFADIKSGGTSVIMVTHDLDAENYSDRTYVMEGGRLKEHLG